MALALIPVGMASYAWRARLLPTWRGAVGRLAEIVIGLSIIIGVSEVFGAVHLFRAVAIVPALAVVGLAAWWVGRQGSTDPAPAWGFSRTGTTSPAHCRRERR